MLVWNVSSYWTSEEFPRFTLLRPFIMENKEASPSLKGPKEVEDGEVLPSINMDQNASKRVLRKIDLHALPLMMILYFAAFLDRYVLSLHLWYQVETSFQLGIDITHRLPTVGQPNPSIDGSGLSVHGRVNLWVSWQPIILAS